MYFMRGFGQKKQTAPDQNHIAPRDRLVEYRHPRFGQSHDPGNREQQTQGVIMARLRPILRAKARCFRGRRPTRIEMKIMLSMPNTISSAVNVPNAIHASGFASQSNISFSCFSIYALQK